ncbi:uncharacterized protein LOC111057885 [Nilaparvata lugens]|uniref:uncharacterized protein LOC111057885 n=1 Tax=Nilaparvata lugens TaxID=108931 RepID=UPI00193E802D|nr:uncharacterized protein LOC111057885 [Nilaparvata lugens]
MENRVRIIEVKYLEPETLTLLKYEGLLEIVPKNRLFNDLSFKVRKYIDDIVRIVGNFQEKDDNLRDVVYTGHNSWQMKLDSSASHNLSVGLFSYSENQIELGDPWDIAECYEEPLYVFTTIMLHTTTGNFLLSNEQKNSASRTQYINTLSNRLWKCYVRKGNQRYSFQRVVNDVSISTQSSPDHFKYIIYPDNVQLHLVARGDNAFYIQIRDFFYKDVSTNNYVDYVGQLVIKRKENEMAGKKWLCGTRSLPDFEPVVQKIAYEKARYTLDNPYMYRSVINDDGVVLQLGSLWKFPSPTLHDTIQCRPEGQSIPDELAKTFYRTRAKRIGNEAASGFDVFEEFFDNWKQELWRCQEPGSPGGFLRIVNHFSIKRSHCEKIKELIHGDGFTLMVGDSTSWRPDCIQIVEIKFIGISTRKHFKYEGKVILLSDDGTELKNKIQAERLRDAAKKDFYYLLNEAKRTVFRKYIGQQGLVLDIKGDVMEKMPLTNRRSKFRCERLSEQVQTSRLKESSKFGNIRLANELTGGKLLPTEARLEDCFTFTTLVWSCEVRRDAE